MGKGGKTIKGPAVAEDMFHGFTGFTLLTLVLSPNVTDMEKKRKSKEGNASHLDLLTSLQVKRGSTELMPP